MFSTIVSVALLAVLVHAQHQQQSHASSYVTFTQPGGHSGGEQSLGGGYGGNSLGLGAYAGSSGSSNQGGASYVSYSQGGSSVGASHAVPVLVQAVPSQSHYQEEPYAHPRYAFKYGVEDKHTGDIKQQEETRDGDVVKGSYSLHEPDGTILTVHYTADKHSGFNAVVQRQGHANHPQHGHH